MSSYVVSDKTIDSIVSLIGDSYRFQKYPLTRSIFKPLVDLGYNLELDEGLQRLGFEMVSINHAAYNSRYKLPADELPCYKMKYTWNSELQSFKNLNCFLYQCSEGPILRHPLYLALKQVEHNIAFALLTSSEEYKTCTWGVD